MPAIETQQLNKVYPAAGSAPSVTALRALDLSVQQGEFFGLLGPNGAGKTTTIGILTTRVLPTAGLARVAGCDVVRDAVTVRSRIGVVPQRPNPDRSLDALENLVYHAAYFGVHQRDATARARRLLDQFEIADKAHAKVGDMSGGQLQRLMIARALIHEPDVLFLDEPTVGLDPQARLALWDILRDLQQQGRTIVLTTHYMDEADRLCERIAIVDRGELLAVDTPAALKRRAPGGTLIELVLDGDASAAAERARTVDGVASADGRNGVLRVYSPRGGQLISPIMQIAEDAGRHVRNISLTEPSLETLFIALTGRKLD